jgi:hypothetical protein
VADFPRPRDRPEFPIEITGFRVVGAEAAADPELAAGDAGVDAAVVVERRRGDRLAVLPFADLGLPFDFAGRLIEGDEAAVELAEEDHPLAQRHPAIGPAAADGVDLFGQFRFVDPELFTGLDVDGENVVSAGDHVHHAFVDDRLRLGRVLGGLAGAVEVGHPDAFQLVDVLTVDFVQRRVASVGEGATVGQPVLLRIGGQLLRSESGGGDDVPHRLAARGRRAGGDDFSRRLRRPGLVSNQEADEEGEAETNESGTKTTEN